MHASSSSIKIQNEIKTGKIETTLSISITSTIYHSELYTFYCIIRHLRQLINIMKIFQNSSVRESLYWVITGYKFVTCIKSLMKINFVSSSADDISNLLTVSYLPLLPV